MGQAYRWLNLPMALIQPELAPVTQSNWGKF